MMHSVLDVFDECFRMWVLKNALDVHTQMVVPDVLVLPVERIKDLCDVSTNSDEHLILDLRRCQVPDGTTHQLDGFRSMMSIEEGDALQLAQNHGSCQRCTAPQSRCMILPDVQIPICLLIGATMSGQLRP